MISNISQPFFPGDIGVIRAVAQGKCGVGIVNHYYVSRMLAGVNGRKDQRLAKKVKVLTPNPAHVNVSAGGIAKYAENKEEASKIARKYYYETLKSKTKNQIISFEGSFHGRTLGALAAGGPSKLESFNTEVNGFKFLDFGDLVKVKEAISEDTAAILIEPLQGEGGVIEAPIEFIKGIRKLCDENNILLIFDEVQCGVGRTGKMFAHQWLDVVPDIMTVAKAIGNGFPLGACLTTEKVG